MASASYLATLLYGYRQINLSGAPLIQRSILNLTGTGVTAVDNPATGATDVTITAGGSGSAITDLVSDVVAIGPGVATATVQGIRGRTVASTAPVDASILDYNGALSTWNPVLVSQDGRLSNTGALTVTGLQTHPISTLAPVSGDMLAWDAGNSWWHPSPSPIGGITQLTSDVVAGPGSGSQVSTVHTLSGAGGVVSVVATSLQWSASVATPALIQAQAAAGNGTYLTVAAQAGAASGATNGGDVRIHAGAKNSSGTNGTVCVYDVTGTYKTVTLGDTSQFGHVVAGGNSGGTAFTVQMGPYPSFETTDAAIWFLAQGTARTSANLAMSGNATDTAFGAPANLFFGVGGTNRIRMRSTEFQFGASFTAPQYVFDLAAAAVMHFGVAATSASIVYDPTSSGNGATLAIRGQDTSFANGNGGSVTISSGAKNGTGLPGAVQARIDTTVMIEAAQVVSGNNVVSLARKAGLTSTQMPANTGDGVVYLGNAATAPTADPVSGSILYNTTAGTYIRDANGITTQIA